jgi:predicted transcriptional regulator
MMDRHEAELISVKRQSELLEVSRTSVYYVPVDKDDEDIPIMHRIDEIYTRWPIMGIVVSAMYSRMRESLSVRKRSVSLCGVWV